MLPLEIDTDSADVHANKQRDEQQVHQSFWSFVESGYFQALTAFVILANTGTYFVEADHPSVKGTLAFPNGIMLCFYIFELFCRICCFRVEFICGALSNVAWNMLDVVVVTAGVFDLWLLDRLNVHGGQLREILEVLRVLRLVRVLKMLKILLASDLSWAERPAFQSFIGVVIAINALLMGFETDIEWTGWHYIEQALLVIYVFELIVSLKKHGRYFFSCNNPDICWNLLDFSIVASSVADSWLMTLVKILKKRFTSQESRNSSTAGGGFNLSQVMMLMRLLRLMRILRLVKLVKAVRPLFILVTGVAAAVQGVAWVLVLTIVILYAMSIMSTRLIGHGILFPDPSKIPDGVDMFATVPSSMFVLFRVMAGAQSDEETVVIDEIMQSIPTIKFFFVFFMVTSSWTLLSILTAVVSDNMMSTVSDLQGEITMSHEDDELAQRKKELNELFRDIGQCQTSRVEVPDSNVNGRMTGVQEANTEEEVTLDYIKHFLSDKENSIRTARTCKIPIRNILDIFTTLSMDGKPVSKEHFIECMVDVSKPAIQQDMMKILAHIALVEESTKESVLSWNARLDSLVLQSSQTRKLANDLKEKICPEARHGRIPSCQFEKFTAKVLDHLADEERRSNQAISRVCEAVQKCCSMTTHLSEKMCVLEARSSEVIERTSGEVKNLRKAIGSCKA